MFGNSGIENPFPCDTGSIRTILEIDDYNVGAIFILPNIRNLNKTIVIDGNNIEDIATFYAEINRVFMAGEDWELGESLDALNDLFYGGFGAIKDSEEIKIIWQNVEKSKKTLGYETTREFYLKKLLNPSRFNPDLIKQKLYELENGMGQTFFEIVVEIISSHNNIDWTEA